MAVTAVEISMYSRLGHENAMQASIVASTTLHNRTKVWKLDQYFFTFNFTLSV